MTRRIIVVDDHDVVRQGVRLILKSRQDWAVIDEASNGNEAVEKIPRLDPDLAVLDISMPEKDGLEVIRDLKALGTATKIVVLSMHNSKELIAAVRDLGASGYILKTNAAKDLIRAIDEIFAGGTFFPGAGATPPGGTRDVKTPDAADSERKNPITNWRLQLGLSPAFAV
ncbi:MAG: response regulator transcription factor [Acidobacteria bacterium]|nr:response regulator transcription factor [Acidobacteriota bacterium]